MNDERDPDHCAEYLARQVEDLGHVDLEAIVSRLSAPKVMILLGMFFARTQEFADARAALDRAKLSFNQRGDDAGTWGVAIAAGSRPPRKLADLTPAERAELPRTMVWLDSGKLIAPGHLHAVATCVTVGFQPERLRIPATFAPFFAVVQAWFPEGELLRPGGVEVPAAAYDSPPLTDEQLAVQRAWLEGKGPAPELTAAHMRMDVGRMRKNEHMILLVRNVSAEQHRFHACVFGLRLDDEDT